MPREYLQVIIQLDHECRDRNQKITSASLLSSRSAPASVPDVISRLDSCDAPKATNAFCSASLLASSAAASRFFFPCTFFNLKNSSLSISSSSLKMYLIVLSSLGMTTCSIALTRRLVCRITSSRIVNAVWSEASSTRVSTAFA